jgi:hypothetical protein
MIYNTAVLTTILPNRIKEHSILLTLSILFVGGLASALNRRSAVDISTKDEIFISFGQ